MTDDYLFNLTQLANAFGFHRDTIRKRLIQARVSAVSVNGNTPLYRLADAAKAVFAGTVGAGNGVDPDELEPAARKAWFDSENARLRFETECGNLIPAHEVAQSFAEFAKAIVNPLDSLPDVLERKASLAPAAIAIVQTTIDAVREQMYLKVANMGGEIE